MYASNYSIDTPSNLTLLPLFAHPIHVPIPLNRYPSMTIRRLSSEDVISPLKPSTQASKQAENGGIYKRMHAITNPAPILTPSRLIIQSRVKAEPSQILYHKTAPIQ
jgi:hypothetical protein